MNEVQLIARLQTTPPPCLVGFRLTATQLPEPFDDNPRSVWLLGRQCGESHGRFLGYPLRDYNTEYDGPECFLSPLAFECSACNTTTELLDTNLHGYHAETESREGGKVGSAKMRGTGPRVAYSCPSCNGQSFEVTVAFVFWYPDELLEFEAPWENLFSVFLCYCKCAGCGKTAQPTEFGKL